MVLLDADHPDVEAFIWCKAREERKARALRDAGFDMDLDGDDGHSIQYQNANNSVRLSDAFMRAVEADGEWELTSRTTGEVLERRTARSLFGQIAEAAWECADPGVQFSTSIDQWHTVPAAGPITASNPCSEFVHLDNTSCNLASLNLLAFLDGDGSFDVERFRHAVDVVFTAQDILVSNAHYPTETIADETARFRPLGLGYTNLGATLMAQGLPYDSDEGRGFAATVTALMTGEAYATSARLAARLGAFAGYEADAESVQRVLRQHRGALAGVDPDQAPSELLEAAEAAWDRVVAGAAESGVRNSQATVLAPTGTISFMMDCDTTGIEPDLALVKQKKLVGGGSISMVNSTVSRALTHLGYDQSQIDAIVDHVESTGSMLGAPGLRPGHLDVFACSMGENVIHHLGHIRMMAAVQPFLSGAISKTTNLPESASVADIEEVFVEAWKSGLKAVAVYRDNCKVGQPLAGRGSRSGGRCRRGPARTRTAAAQPPVPDAVVPRRRLPRLPHGRRVRRRPARRDLPEGGQAGLDALGNHGCLRHLGQPRSAVRRAAAGLRRGLRGRSLRAGRHHRRSRPQVGGQPRRLHLPPIGARLTSTSRCGGTWASWRPRSVSSHRCPVSTTPTSWSCRQTSLIPDRPQRSRRDRWFRHHSARLAATP